MLTLNRNTLVLAFTLAMLLAAVQAASSRHHNCEVKAKCSTQRNIAWATDNRRCYVFRNHCMLRARQCELRKKGQEDLFETDRETCMQNCEMVCAQNFEPVCATFFNDEQITFSNKCEMRNFMCSQERTYTFYTAGECADAK